MRCGARRPGALTGGPAGSGAPPRPAAPAARSLRGPARAAPSAFPPPSRPRPYGSSAGSARPAPARRLLPVSPAPRPLRRARAAAGPGRARHRFSRGRRAGEAAGSQRRRQGAAGAAFSGGGRRQPGGCGAGAHLRAALSPSAARGFQLQDKQRALCKERAVGERLAERRLRCPRNRLVLVQLPAGRGAWSLTGDRRPGHRVSRASLCRTRHGKHAGTDGRESLPVPSQAEEISNAVSVPCS